MTDKVLKTLNEHRMLSGEEIVGVGLSGGADSVTLLHILWKNKDKLNIKELVAIHLHHGIRGAEADRDMEFCKSLCEKLNIKFICYKADIPSESKKTGESIEECARRIRYECFEKSNCNIIATAHNLSDNIETFILNLARGASLNGLCGIPYVRCKYIRPLLDCTREEIEQYIKDNNLSYVTDSTNFSDDYSRNKIRHSVIPELYNINPSFDKAFLRCLESIYMTEDFLIDSAKEIILKSKKDGYYNCNEIKKLDNALKYKVITLILNDNSVKNINRKQIEQISNVISNNGSVTLNNEIILNVEHDKLYFGKAEIVENFQQKLNDFNGIYDLPIGKYEISILSSKDLQKLNKKTVDNFVDCDKIIGSVVIRNRINGDKYCPYNRRMTKTLKNLFNEAKMLVYERSNMAILSDECGIIWTECFGVSERCKPTDKTTKFLKITKTGE